MIESRINLFVTAIDTDSGKTLTSAILAEAFQADYWKPIQAGLPRDSETVQALLSNTRSRIHPERHLLRTPSSPHAAAKIDGVKISLDDFELPETENSVIIEGAGGCLVPLNDRDFVADMIVRLNIPTAVVADLYLGSINHTLLTCEALRARGVNIKGIIFNGASNPESERIILLHSSLKCLLRINREEKIDKAVVKKYSDILKSTWQ